MDPTPTVKGYNQMFDRGLSDGPGSQPAILPDVGTLEQAIKSLYLILPKIGVGLAKVQEHLTDDVVPGLNRSSQSPNYYGFVTGGVTPAAAFADSIVTLFDQNVQVHLPRESIATVVEDAALQLLLSLFDLDREAWNGRTFTTGATASNIHGLACAREFIVESALCRAGHSALGIAEVGIVAACKKAGIEKINILTTLPHSSTLKAASILGFGRDAVINVGLQNGPRWKFDFVLLEQMLRLAGTVSIVVVSCGEVNTGRFATAGAHDFVHLRDLCDRYSSWIHVDGAFGLFARLLSAETNDPVRLGVQGIELADSITGDAHKLLNVPYDCGFFFTRYRLQVFQNYNATYLNTASDTTDILSPLNVGIENSRRFRALPVYATLIAYGRDGYVNMLQRQIRLARLVASFILSRPEDFELLPVIGETDNQRIENIFIVVLFRARDGGLNQKLVSAVNASRRIYVSGTIWDSRPASRIAVANWQADPERDIVVVTEVLTDILQQWRGERRERTP